MNGRKTPRFWMLICLLLPALALAGDTAEKIDFTRLAAMIDAEGPLLLVDTRSEDPFRSGHIPTAVNIPGYLFDKDSIPGLPENRELPIAVYCNGNSCGISNYVAERLLDLGYERVYVYPEGSDGWKKKGRELISAKQAQLPTIGRPDLAALLATGAVVQLIDARQPDEFAARTLPQAVNLTVGACRPKAPSMPVAADRAVVVFGQGRWDGRPYRVADCLHAWGFRDVRIFAAGVNGWPAD